MNTLEENAFAYLNNLLKFGIKLNLKNITTLLEKLSNPHKNVRCIHIAGTNGKGSVSCLLANALQNSGLKTGLFTSPYLVHFNERWRINGKTISTEKLVSFITKISQLKLDLYPTYFEVITAISFLWFAEENVDIAILETGMGGRLDATNVCNPIATIITNITLDHTQYLGDTISKIAQEKAGIIKKDIPIIIGEMDKEAYKVITKKAQSLNAQVIDSSKYTINKHSNQKVTIDGNEIDLQLKGNHQLQNTQIAYATIEYLYDKKIIKNKKIAYQGIAKSYWAGRFDYISNTLVIDGAHNPNSTENLVKEIKILHPQQKWHIYFACMNDKDWKQNIDILVPIAKKWSLYQLENPRATNIKIIADYLLEKSQNYKITSILPNKKTKEYTLATGSLYFIGEILSSINKKSPLPISKQK